MKKTTLYAEKTKDAPPELFVVEAARLMKRKGNAVDLGCGSGKESKALRELGFKVWAFDIDARAIQLAKNKGIPAFELDIRAVPFVKVRFEKIGKVNFIVCLNVLHMMRKEEGKNVLRNAWRVLDKGGKFALSFWGPNDKWKRKCSLYSLKEILACFPKGIVEFFQETKGMIRVMDGMKKGHHYRLVMKK